MNVHWHKPNWVNGGTVRTCPNPDCQEHFISPPFTGQSGKDYCSRHCRAEMSDEVRPQ